MLTVVTIQRLGPEATREEADRLVARLGTWEPPGTITASVVEGEPVILAGLVKGGEYVHFGEWARSQVAAMEELCVSATGRIVTDNDSALYADYPLTWYRYPEKG